MASRTTPLQLDLNAILRSRLPRRISRFIPGWAIGLLKRLICQDDLNALLREAFPAEGSAFSQSIIEQLGITLEVKGLSELKDCKRLIFALNHPLGGMDGITIVKLLGETYGDENIRVLVNDMLMNVEPLASVFLPINKYGGQARASARTINQAYASDMQICIFPAGLVSRLGNDKKIRDLEWQKAVAAKAIEFDREIVPVHFEALNSGFFYKTARLRKRLGIKINLEQALLPREVFHQRNKRFRITFGSPISAKELSNQGLSPAQIASRLRDMVYSLA